MKIRKWLLRIFLVGFVLFNISAAFHGYKFTHFAKSDQAKSQADKLSKVEKLGLLFFGISNPRPENKSSPQSLFELVEIISYDEKLEGWYLETDSAKGEVILFHGYSGEKSAMLKRARLIREMGFNTLLVDFRGSGGSTGNTTTIGFEESKDVIASIEYLNKAGKKNIYLMGTSMGAAAILKAISEEDLPVKGIILECPFASLLQTAKNRFVKMGLPTFPAAHFLVFWGGIENGFWGFSHNPSTYSKAVNIPSLLIYGEKDARVRRFETDEIFANLAGDKNLLLFPNAAHGNYLEVDPTKWTQAVASFLP